MPAQRCLKKDYQFDSVYKPLQFPLCQVHRYFKISSENIHVKFTFSSKVQRLFTFRKSVQISLAGS